MRQNLSILIFALGFLLGRGLPSQSAPFFDVDRGILALKAEGKYVSALERSFQALQQLVKKPNLDSAGEARAEFLFELTESLAGRADRRGDLIEIFRGLRKAPAIQKLPLLDAVIGHALARNLFRLGKTDKARAEMRVLGYLSDFQVLGPLDNERGSGFQRSFFPEEAPEKALDLKRMIQGKKREVGFRRMRLSNPLFQLNLGSRLRPNRQVLAYAVFQVTTDDEMSLALRLGSTGSFVVFVNGQEIGRRDIQERPLSSDQDAFGFRTRRGRNLVVIKLCTQSSRFMATLRLTLPNGRPIPGTLDVSADPKALVGIKGLKKPSPKVAVRVGASEYLTGMVDRGKDLNVSSGEEARRVGAAAFQLSYLLARKGADEETNRRDRQAALRATQLLPEFGPAWFLYGYTLIKRGASDADREENPRYQAWEKAISVWPRYAEAMRNLAEMERTLRKNWSKASVWVNKALAINPRFVGARIEKIRVLKGRDLDLLADKELLQLLEDPEGKRSASVLSHGVVYLLNHDRTKKALELAKKRVELDARVPVRQTLARLLFRLGKRNEAKAVLAKLMLDYPQNRELPFFLQFNLVAEGDLVGAWRALQQRLAICPQDEQAILGLARIAAMRGRKDLQIGFLEKALRLDPNLKKERRHLEFLQKDQKPFFAGFEFDGKSLIAQDPGAPKGAKKAGDSHYYLLRHTLVRAYRDGTQSRYVHFVAKILNEEGARLFDTYRPPFFSSDQDARILEARVIHADGSSTRARLGRVYWVDLPPIKAGDYVEVKARVDDRERSFFGDYFGLSHLFVPPEAVGMYHSVLDLILEEGRNYHFQRVGDVPEPLKKKLEDGASYLRYDIPEIPRRDIEERAPSPRERGPLLRVSTYGDWNEFASWWWNLIRKQMVPTPEIKEKVVELTKDQKTLEDKVRKIYEFVVTDVRYVAWEFGVHGYKPYSVGSIFGRRHGDCKDKAILLNTMLSQIGVKAWPVLIRGENVREKDDLSLPLVEHFNHCISYVPEQPGLKGRFLDGTAEYHPVDTLPLMDAGARVLLVEGGKGRIVQVPWTDPNRNRDQYQYAIQLKANGDAEVVMRRNPHLNFGPPVRQTYGNEAGRRKEKLADRLGSIFGQVEITDFEFSNLRDLGVPVQYRVNFKVKKLAEKIGEGYRVRIAYRPIRLARLTAAATRKFDMLLNPPSGRDVEIRYLAPKGFEWAGIPKGEKIHYPGLGGYECVLEKDGTTLVVRRVFQMETQRVPAKRYPDLQNLFEKVEKAEGLDLKLQRSH
jgi:tetratricopeptide (TPR) repeat protein/transglutaminase-like putative cysteine protease